MMIVAEVLILLGALFLLVSSLGTFRFRDVYNRLHAASISTSGGSILTGIGLSLLASLHKGTLVLRPLLIVLVIFVLSPVSSHVLAQAAYRTGVQLAPETVQDDLALASLDFSETPLDAAGGDAREDEQEETPMAEPVGT